MKVKTLVSVLLVLTIVLCGFCACSGDNQGETTTAETSEGTTLAQTTTDDESTVIAELPTNSEGKITDTDLVVTELTVYERKNDGTLVKQTEFSQLSLSTKTVDFAGEQKEALSGEIEVSADTDYVSFELTCALNSMAGIAMGKVFNRSDGDKALEVNYKNSKGEEMPLKINVIF